MKRICALLLTVVALLTLFSCKTESESSTPNNSTAGGKVYGKGVNTVIVASQSTVESLSNKIDLIANDINSYTGIYPKAVTDAAEKSANEIVIGETVRPISVKAMELLNGEIKKTARNSSDEEAVLEDLIGYAIYAEGGSVAVVWSDWHIDELTIDYFIDNYIVDDNLVIDEGYTKIETFSLIEYLTERGNNLREEQWAALEEKLGSEYGPSIVEALRNLYAIYAPSDSYSDMVSWLANLYDADIGGFYHSNSARNTESFLPDIESTGAALGLIEELGMAEMFDNDYSKALPAEMLQKIGKWVQSLQEEDGYFYHPQWPKSYIYEKGLQSRITRDRGSAIRILRKVGLTATYATSSIALEGRLSYGTDVVTAVSKILPTAEILTQFESVEAFQAYIDELDAQVMAISDPDDRAYKLYSIGNTFQSTTSQVAKNPEYVTILHNFFKKHQNPDTGTWSSVITVNATSSLHKIGSVYNSLGLPYEYIDQMVETVIKVLSLDVNEYPIHSGVEFGNAWACLEHIYANIRMVYGNSEEGVAKLNEIKNKVYSIIVDAINTTTFQVAAFRQDDGSFGTTRYGSSSTDQGVPTAVAGTAEGDVNGYGCIVTTIIDYIFDALDLPDYEVKLYSEKERVEFVRIIEDLGTIIKDTEDLVADTPITFDDGQMPEQIVAYASSGGYEITDGASVTVEALNGNNALHIVAADSKGAPNRQNHSIDIPIGLSKSGANVAVMEFDIFVDKNGSTTHKKLIEWSIRHNGTLFIYPTIGKTSANKVVLYDGSGAELATLGNTNETIKLRFEYYFGEQEYKVYVNGAFKAKGNVFYNSAYASKSPTEMTLYSPKGMNANYYLDNIYCYRITKDYDPDETVYFPETPVTEDFETGVTSEKVGEGYNVITDKGVGVTYSSNRTNNGGATAIVRTDEETGNKFLTVYAPGREVNNGEERAHSISMFTATPMSEKPNAYVFETDIKLNSVCPSTNFLQVVFLNQTNGYRYGQLNMTVDADGIACLAGVRIGYFDQWFKLRLEYFTEQGVIRVYSDDLYMGEITTFSASDTTTGKDVAKLGTIDKITGFSINGYNGAAFCFSVDNLTVYTKELEYTEREVDTLPEKNPDPDTYVPTPGTYPNPETGEEPDTGDDTGSVITPDVEFSGMEPPMSLPDDITPDDSGLSDEDFGEWT